MPLSFPRPQAVRAHRSCADGSRLLAEFDHLYSNAGGYLDGRRAAVAQGDRPLQGGVRCVPYAVRAQSYLSIYACSHTSIAVEQVRLRREYAAARLNICRVSACPWVVEQCKRVEDTDSHRRGQACRRQQSLGYRGQHAREWEGWNGVF